jgi:hypothetical protein
MVPGLIFQAIAIVRHLTFIRKERPKPLAVRPRRCHSVLRGHAADGRCFA